MTTPEDNHDARRKPPLWWQRLAKWLGLDGWEDLWEIAGATA